MLDIGDIYVAFMYDFDSASHLHTYMYMYIAAAPVYGAEYGRHLLMFVIGTTYATISPIVLPFTCKYISYIYNYTNQIISICIPDVYVCVMCVCLCNVHVCNVYMYVYAHVDAHI